MKIQEFKNILCTIDQIDAGSIRTRAASNDSNTKLNDVIMSLQNYNYPKYQSTGIIFSLTDVKVIGNIFLDKDEIQLVEFVLFVTAENIKNTNRVAIANTLNTYNRRGCVHSYLDDLEALSISSCFYFLPDKFYNHPSDSIKLLILSNLLSLTEAQNVALKYMEKVQYEE